MAKRWKVSAFVLTWLGLAASAHAQYLPPAGPMGGGYPGAGMMPPPGMSGIMQVGAPGGQMTGGADMGQMPPQGGQPGPGSPPTCMPEVPADVGSLEGLAPNAFSSGDSDPNAFHAREEFHLDYLVLWYRADSLPATITTGSINDSIPGALGQPGTKILNSGGQGGGATAALRTSFVYWLAVPEILGWETSFMIMEQRTKIKSFTSDAAGSPVISRPIFDFNFGMESADPRSFPGALSGRASDQLTTRLMGAESNLKWNVSGGMHDAPSFFLLAGPRWLELNERYRSDDFANDLPLGEGVQTKISDNLTTFNNFFGGQIGTQFRFGMDRFTFDFVTKLAVGENRQTLKIRGETSELDTATGVVTTDTQGLFAQSSNAGTYRRNRVSVLPELDVGMSVALSQNAKFTIGYTYFDINHVLRPGEQIDHVAGIPVLLLPVVPAHPTETLRESSFWAQSINLGLEVDY